MIPPRDRLYIPKSFGDLLENLNAILLCSPKFVDPTGGYEPWRSLEARFYTFNEGIRDLRSQLGEECYEKLAAMSDRIRACFQADPDETTGETRKGKDLVYDMEDLIKARRAEMQASKNCGRRADRRQ
jgi:hypothetical protein